MIPDLDSGRAALDALAAIDWPTPGLVASVFAAWMVLACLGGCVWSLAAHRPKPAEPAPDAEWLRVWPTQDDVDTTRLALGDDDWLTDGVVRDRLREIERQEGWAEA